MMGINIPDMIQIVKEHHLIPVPVDYDIDTMAPKDLNDVVTLTTDKVRHINYRSLLSFRQNRLKQ